MWAFLDDVRDPPSTYDVVWRTYDEAVTWLLRNGCPDHISFDHDLGLCASEGGSHTGNGNAAKTGLDVAKWIVREDEFRGGAFIPRNFTYRVHSQNFSGAKNIEAFLRSYLTVRRERVRPVTREESAS